MKKNLRRFVSAALLVAVLMGLVSTTAMAVGEAVWIPIQSGEAVTGSASYNDHARYVITVDREGSLLLNLSFSKWISVKVQDKDSQAVAPTMIDTSGAWGESEGGAISFAANEATMRYNVQRGVYYISMWIDMPSIDVATIGLTAEVLAEKQETEDGKVVTNGNAVDYNYHEYDEFDEEIGAIPSDKVAYTNPLIVKGGLDYDMVTQREDGYFETEKDGKHGLLDEAGNEIIPPVYTDIGDISDGMARVANSIDGTWTGSRKYGFVDVSTGELTIPVEYVENAQNEGERSISDFFNGVAIEHTALGKYVSGELDLGAGLKMPIMAWRSQSVLIDKTGKTVLPMVYDSISSSFRSWTGPFGYLADTGIASLSDSFITDFSDGLIYVGKDGKTYAADLQGNILFELPSGFVTIDGYYDGLALVYKDGKYGFLDKKGNIAIPLQYDSADQFGDHSGYIRVGTRQGGKMQYGLIDLQGNLIVPMAYDAIDTFSEGMAAVHKDGKGGFVDLSGQLVIPLIYDKVGRFHDGLAQVGVWDERLLDLDESDYQSRWGYVDKTGQEVIPLKYSEISDFEHGVARVYEGTFNPWSVFADREATAARFKELGITPKCYYIDTNGNVIFSAETSFQFPSAFYGLDRFYVDKINGEYAILRNPLYREDATPNRSTVLVNGEQVAFDAYTINQNNYFKLRDLAKVLSGTGKQFEVTWDGGNNAINMLPGKPYTAVGGELTQGDGADKTAAINTATIYLDGQPIYLTAYTINQNNYFKLRDVGEAFDFDVSWDGARNTIVIDTTQSYTAD